MECATGVLSNAGGMHDTGTDNSLWGNQSVWSHVKINTPLNRLTHSLHYCVLYSIATYCCLQLPPGISEHPCTPVYEGL